MTADPTRFAETRDAVLAAARQAAADYTTRPGVNMLGAVVAAALSTIAARKPMGRWGADDLEELAAAVAGLSTADAFAAVDRARAADRGDLIEHLTVIAELPSQAPDMADQLLDVGYRRHRAGPHQPARNGVDVGDPADLFRPHD